MEKKRDFLKKKVFYPQSESDRKFICQLIDSEVVLLAQTDTIFGFLSSITEKNFLKINKLKGREPNKPYLILIDSLRKLLLFIDSEQLTDHIKSFLSKVWPGPLTIIFRAKKGLPSYMQSSNNTIALRCPDHEGLLEVLKNFDGLFSTSANKSGQIVPENLEQIDKDIIKECPFVLVNKEASEKNTENKKASTIIDLSRIDSSFDDVYIMREGAYPVKILESYYGKCFKK